MRPKISNLFNCNLEGKQRRKNLIDLAKCSYNGMNTFMKTHIVLNYTLNDNNVTSDYIASIYDAIIEESVLKNKLSLFLEMKKREHEVMIIEPNPTQPKSTHPNPTQSNPTESNQSESIPTQTNSKWCIIIGIQNPPSKEKFDVIISATTAIDGLKI